MKTKQSEKNTGRGQLWWIALAALLLGLILVIGGVGAKYVISRNSPKNLAEAYEFYFTSNYLQEGDEPVVIPVNPGTKSLSFDLYNAEDELRYSELPINYELTLTKPEDSTATLDPASGKLEAGRVNQATITLSGLKDGGEYIVTATGTNGYSKTLQAKFVVGTDAPHVYKNLVSYDDYVVLRVWTEGNVKGDAVITYPVGLIPDNTDPAMRGWTTGAATGTDSDSFRELYASHQYRFFGNASINGFEVTVGEEMASEKTMD